MNDQELTLRMLQNNAMVFDRIFGAITQPRTQDPAVVLPAGDGTCNTEPDEVDGCPA